VFTSLFSVLPSQLCNADWAYINYNEWPYQVLKKFECMRIRLDTRPQKRDGQNVRHVKITLHVIAHVFNAFEWTSAEAQ